MKSLVPLRCQRPLVAVNCAAHERLNRFKVARLPVSLKISDVVHGVIKNKHTSKVQTGLSLFKSGIQTNSCFSRRAFHLTRLLCFSFEAGFARETQSPSYSPFSCIWWCHVERAWPESLRRDLLCGARSLKAAIEEGRMWNASKDLLIFKQTEGAREGLRKDWGRGREVEEWGRKRCCGIFSFLPPGSWHRH